MSKSGESQGKGLPSIPSQVTSHDVVGVVVDVDEAKSFDCL